MSSLHHQRASSDKSLFLGFEVFLGSKIVADAYILDGDPMPVVTFWEESARANRQVCDLLESCRTQAHAEFLSKRESLSQLIKDSLGHPARNEYELALAAFDDCRFLDCEAHEHRGDNLSAAETQIE